MVWTLPFILNIARFESRPISGRQLHGENRLRRWRRDAGARMQTPPVNSNESYQASGKKVRKFSATHLRVKPPVTRKHTPAKCEHLINNLTFDLHLQTWSEGPCKSWASDGTVDTVQRPNLYRRRETIDWHINIQLSNKTPVSAL